MTAKDKDTIPDFEKAMERLEEIADLLESGGESISLEKSLELYEEGSGLAAMCVARLRDAEQRITELAVNTVRPGSGDDEGE